MKISVIILVGFSVILGLFSLTTYVNFRQSQVVNEDAEWVSKSQLIIRHTSRFQRNFIEMQSDLRGFLLTDEPLFMEPYEASLAENNELSKELYTLIPDTSFQNAKLTEIRNLCVQWRHDFADPLIQAKKKASSSANADQAFARLYHKSLGSQAERQISDEIRDKFREFNNYEYDLRAKRKDTLNESETHTRLLSIYLTSASIFIGIAIVVYITYVISKRIRHMVNLADRLAKGNFTTLIEDTARDELSHLSQSLNSMARILDENISALERKNQELDRFAYVVSHDLKAPLRGIENASTWMEEDFAEELPPKAKEYLGMMKGRVRRMENLIDGILELSRVGKDKKPMEKVNVKRLILEILEMLAPQSALKFHIQPNLPTILTEKIPLQQLFTNLISNAIKYHHPEGGNIFIRYQETNKFYEFTVADDGPGIEPEYHEKIFIIFQTLQERDAFESTGVGLAIVKKILADKKCTIKLQSEIGRGASFTFTWPKRTEGAYSVS